MASMGFLELFGELPDPRMDRQKPHSLMDILLILPMNRDAVICGTTPGACKICRRRSGV